MRRVHAYLGGQGLGPLLVKAVFGSASLRILGMGFGFLVGVQLARGLGVEGYGTYGIAMAIVSVLGVPTEFGLPQLLTREVAAAYVRGDVAELRAARRWANRVVLAMSGLIAGGMVVYLLAMRSELQPGLAETLIAAMVMIPLVAVAKLNGATLRGLQQIVRGQIPDTLVRPAVFSALLALASLFLLQMTPWVAMACGAAGAGVALISSSWMLSGSLRPHKAPIAMEINRARLWRSAFPMALTEGMRTVQGQMAVMFLGWAASVAAVGLYRTASSIAIFIAMPISLFNIVGGPLIARLYASGQIPRLQTLLGFLSLGMLVGTALISAPFFLAGEWLIGIVFGAEFVPAASILRILCLGVMANAFFGANAMLLNMSGYETCVTRASMVSLGGLAALLCFAALRGGAEGAAWAVSAVLTGWNILLWCDAKRLLQVDTTLVSLLNRNLSARGRKDG